MQLIEPDFSRRLNISLRARVTLIVVITPEEERAVSQIREVCETWDPPRQCIAWDSVDGFSVIAGTKNFPSQSRDPLTALDDIVKTSDDAVIILKDFHEYWNNPQVKRRIRNFSQAFRYNRRTIMIVTPTPRVPDEIRDEAVIIHFPPPNATELSDDLDTLIATSGIPCSLSPGGREKIIQAALGMTLNQARRAFSKAIVTRGTLDDQDIDAIIADKKDILNASDALEFYSYTETPENVGGLLVLKEWLGLRERAFTQEARDFGLPAPKGIALIGIPGTGKSLTAKMIADIWHLPLLRLDVGALFGSLVGESEERTRRALALAETISPCILWVDEIEKAFAFGSGDAGTSQRVFAHLLTWMQDKTSPCFVVATANNIAALPPELLRKGRFDEIFFLDLPTREERREIFTVHLRKRKCIPAEFDLDTLARESEGYVGAEIEQTIIDAMYRAFNEKMRRVTTDDILSCMQAQVPLSVSQRETVAALRAWLAEGRAQSASRTAPARAPINGKTIALETFANGHP
ncbi:AAA family ATPase [Methanoregula sp.]|uniref:AAA family ATPase n=1 Tax=Methanoregula sp. TaxID=2052170 RepID=UPI002370934D|nr:AAA family ATPase [Methanoregula sp.]MDD1686626.1 AAA family ATPase [Methanoregula sp.]